MSGVLAAHQPNYAPYLGFLHKAKHADVMILQDDLKYVKNDFGNRNRVQSEDTWRWLTIPVHAATDDTFASATTADPKWAKSHANILRAKYLRAAHADRLGEYLDLLQAEPSDSLAVIAIDLLRLMFERLEVTVPVTIESELELGPFENPNDRLIELCRRFDCHTYLSGTGAMAYIELDRWEAAGLTVTWSDFEPVPYERGSAPWIPNLSTLDAIAHADDPRSLIA